MTPRRGLSYSACVVLLLAACLTHSAHAQIQPGEYVGAYGRGVLRIMPDKGGTLRFKLNTVGANFHTCELEGVIRNHEARLEESAHEKLPCIVTFKTQKDGIAVESKHERACSTYCGVRAHFEGPYILPPPACAPSAVRRTRDQFKVAYDKKLLTQARALLAPVVEKCSSLLSEYEDAWVRNDLAIAHYHAGDRASCRDALLKWVDLARQSDQDIKDGYPPSDAEEWLRIARATRYNLKLCGAPLPVGGQSAK